MSHPHVRHQDRGTHDSHISRFTPRHSVLGKRDASKMHLDVVQAENHTMLIETLGGLVCAYLS